MKKLFFAIVLLPILSIKIFAGVGEGVSPVGTLTSYSYGTTVIVHGLNPDENYSLSQAQNWTLTLAEAIAHRLGGGKIYIISEGYVQLLENIGTGAEKILVWDWLLTSQCPKFGFSEGAGDALAAILINEANKANPLWNLNKIHFIGHSRGTIVSSEAIQRLGIYSDQSNITIDNQIHFTTLDAHPWDDRLWDNIGEPYSANDYSVNGKQINKGVVAWGNVKYADNYWHYTNNPLNFTDLNGLDQIPGFNYNKNLSPQDGKYTGMTHGKVHAWYHGTVDSAAVNDAAYDPLSIDESGDWYLNDERITNGFNIDKNTVATSSTISIWDDETINMFSIFNGDFQKVPAYSKVIIEWPEYLSLALRNISPPITPGWISHGGGGTGHIDGYLDLIFFTIFNPHLELDRDNEFLTHNYFFIPKSVDKISFRLSVSNKSNNGDILEVYLGNTIVSEFGLGQKYNYLIKSILIPSTMKGTSQTLSFKIKPGSTTTDSEVFIDDIGFGLNFGISPMLAVYPNSLGKLSLNKTQALVSDVQLHVYDHLGRHTGLENDTVWVTDIPGSSYYTDVDSFGIIRIQIILPPSDYEYNFVLTSLEDNSNCDFAIDDYSNISSYLSEFNEIQLEQSGSATVSYLNSDTVITMQIDSDGDGIIDSLKLPTKLHINYLLTTETDGNGIISPSDSIYIADGENLTFAILPNTNYMIADVLVDGNSVGAISEYTFTSINSDHSILASFTPVSDVNDEINIPKEFYLSQNYPNPFNPITNISYAIPRESFMTIKVYDIMGNELKTLVSTRQRAGYYDVQFDGLNLTSGVYFYSLKAGEYKSTKKMMLIK